MKSKVRIFIIGSLILLGVVTGWIIPSSAAAFGHEIHHIGMHTFRSGDAQI
jgi:hypothetical protein